MVVYCYPTTTNFPERPSVLKQRLLDIMTSTRHSSWRNLSFNIIFHSQMMIAVDENLSQEMLHVICMSFGLVLNSKHQMQCHIALASFARCAKRNAPDVEERATTTLQSHKCFGIQRNTKANAKILWWPLNIQSRHSMAEVAPMSKTAQPQFFIEKDGGWYCLLYYCDDSVSFAWTPRT